MPLQQGRQAKKKTLYSKSEKRKKLTIGCSVTWAWPGRVDLCSRWIVYYQARRHHMQHGLAPRHFPKPPDLGNFYRLPSHSPPSHRLRTSNDRTKRYSFLKLTARKEQLRQHSVWLWVGRRLLFPTECILYWSPTDLNQLWGPADFPFQWVIRTLFPKCSVEMKDVWCCISVPPNVLIVFCLIN